MIQEKHTPTTILDSIQYINGLMINTNENELNIFFHLAAISVTESWKNASFYKGTPYLKKYMDKKFSALMVEVFRKTTMWFRSMEGVLSIHNGRVLLLKHGRDNMVAYRGFSPDEQELVLKMAEENPIATFHSLLKSAGLKGKQNPDNEENKNSAWEKKYKELEKKHAKLEKKHAKAIKEIGILKTTIRNMMHVGGPEVVHETHA